MKGPRQAGTAVTHLGILCPGRLGQGEARQGSQQQKGCVGRCGASPQLQLCWALPEASGVDSTVVLAFQPLWFKR